MTDAGLAHLRQFLVERYDDLRSRLTHRLGSADDASDALNETYLRLDRAEAVVSVRAPTAYLIRMAINIVADRRRVEKRRGSRLDIETVLDLVDETPGPDRILEAQSDFLALRGAVQELTPRQREILFATKLDHVSRTDIARRLGVSRRLVHAELKRALEICQRHVEKM
jgi:RNA polymerase sigma-70 factor (ECF subfamily)